VAGRDCGVAEGGSRLVVMQLPMRLPEPDLKTKLLLMMLSLLLLSSASLFLLHLRSERQLLSQVRDYTDELSSAIEIAQEQPGTAADPIAALGEYANELRKLGVRDVTITDAADEVQASTNPAFVGRKVPRKKRGSEFVVRGVLGDPSGGNSQRVSTFTIPLVVGDRRVGTLVVSRYLDDFTALAQAGFVSRLLATLGVFAVGMLLSVILSWSLSRPLRDLTLAARSVAEGDLSVKVTPRGGGEIARVSRTFNEMVVRLREQKVLEERLHFAERSTSLGRLASAMAHEIRNPLNFINLSIDHLASRLGPDDAGKRTEYDRILLSVKAEISRLNRLVSGFLSFGRPMRLDRRACEVAGLVGEVAALVEPKARDQAVVLDVEAEPDLPVATADPELLKTCFLNLFINALDAMPGGGHLRARVTHEKDPSGASFLAIVVADSGHGMDTEAIRDAFEPYFSTKEAGFGLGLALTKKIVEDHGGTISLESEPDRGTTVRLTIPVTPTAVVEPVVAL